MEEIIHIYEFLSREEEPLKIFQELHWTHNILLRAYSWPKIDNWIDGLGYFSPTAGGFVLQKTKDLFTNMHLPRSDYTKVIIFLMNNW